MLRLSALVSLSFFLEPQTCWAGEEKQWLSSISKKWRRFLPLNLLLSTCAFTSLQNNLPSGQHLVTRRRRVCLPCCPVSCKDNFSLIGFAGRGFRQRVAWLLFCSSLCLLCCSKSRQSRQEGPSLHLRVMILQVRLHLYIVYWWGSEGRVLWALNPYSVTKFVNPFLAVPLCHRKGQADRCV